MTDMENEIVALEKDWAIPNVVLDDAPLKELTVKAHQILASESHETLDAVVCRLADVIPEGVTEDNFTKAKPLAGMCKKWFSNVEKLRQGLKRPALDWGKAVDTAAKEWVARAEPTLQPIIDKVKKIEDRRKAEKLAAEAAEAKRVEDERLAAEKAHRDLIEAEQAAERKRLEAIAEANRKEAARLAKERQDIEEMKRWVAEHEAKDKKAIVEAPDDKMVAIPDLPFDNLTMTDDHSTWLKEGGAAQIEKGRMAVDAIIAAETLAGYTPPEPDWPPTLLPSFDNDAPSPELDWPPPSAKFVNEELRTMPRKPWPEVLQQAIASEADDDQQKVRDVGKQIAAFKDSIRRPLVVSSEAKQAIELAVFDLCEVANRLQEWRMP